MTREEHLINTIGNDYVKVSIDEKVHVGCNKCGACCKKTVMQLTAYDLYNMAKKVPLKEMLNNNLVFTSGSSGPSLSIKSKENKRCMFSKINHDGDYECKLGDNKPLLCNGSFVATSNMCKNYFSFVPFDEEIEVLDIDKIADEIVDGSEYLFVNSQNNMCKADKQDVKLTEYLGTRYEHRKENAIAQALKLMINRYIDFEKMMKILILTDSSSINILNVSNDEVGYVDKITKIIYQTCFFYFDENKDDFIEQTIKASEVLQNKVMPKVRILYEFLYKVFDPSMVQLDKIIDIKDMKEAQKAFDCYYIDNLIEICKRFKNCVSIMGEKMSEFND